MKYHLSSFGDFRCAHCHVLVSSAQLLSGVNNRNHCPYCLWSCHLDLYAAGDRLSACKAPMKPIGLTMKKSRNKYRLEARGELMLIHECVDCKTLSINRMRGRRHSGKDHGGFPDITFAGPTNSDDLPDARHRDIENRAYGTVATATLWTSAPYSMIDL